MPIRAYLAVALLSFGCLFVAGPSAQAGELEPADAEVLGNILRSATGIQDISYDRVACRFARLQPTICTYNHTNGSHDSFAWFKAAKAAEVLLKYKAGVKLQNGLTEVSIANLSCGASLCIFD